MLKMIKESINGNIGKFKVEIEGKSEPKYTVVFDLTDKFGDPLESDFPDNLKMYESMARTAIDDYIGKEIPNVINAMWY